MITKEYFLEVIEENKSLWEDLKKEVIKNLNENDLTFKDFYKYHAEKDFNDFVYYFCVRNKFKYFKKYVFKLNYNDGYFLFEDNKSDFFKIFKENTDYNEWVQALYSKRGKRNVCNGDILNVQLDFKIYGEDIFKDLIEKMLFKYKLERKLVEKGNKEKVRKI